MSLLPTPELLADLKRFERDPKTQGPALNAYPDPISKGDPWTNGWGHTGTEVHQGLVITEAQADQNLFADATKALVGVVRAWGWVSNLDPVRRDAMAHLCFNLGLKTLIAFTTFLGLMAIGQYKAAAKDLTGTRWYKQVNGDGRGGFVVACIRDGVRPQ